MFSRPFKVKTNYAVKNSDRKKLRDKLTASGCSVNDDALSTLVPSKGDLTVAKVESASGKNMLIYSLAPNPVFVDADDFLFPTVYALWRFPDIVPCFRTWPPVLEKLQKGADLMLPGVVLIPDQAYISQIGSLRKNSICSIRLVGNKAAVAVGMTLMSGDEMLRGGMKGKGVKILHVIQDQLWSSGEKSQPPSLPEELSVQQGDTDSEEEEDEAEAPVENIAANMEEMKLEEATSASPTPAEEESSAENMDQLLYDCFMVAIKKKAKDTDLPLLCSNFYKNFILPCCPEGRQLDVKKTKYKKIMTFLKEMSYKSLIDIEETKPGVDAIVAIRRDSPELVEYFIPIAMRGKQKPAEVPEATNEFQPPIVQDMFMVNAAVLPFFQLYRQKKGDALTLQDVRRMVNEFVRIHQLQDERDRRMVNLSGPLREVLGADRLSFEELFERLQSRMAPAYQVTFPGEGPRLMKGKLPLITLSVARRASNKKVTMITHLEAYGIDAQEFSRQIQSRVAASTSATEIPGKPNEMQVLVQGSRVKEIGAILTGDYHLPSKFIQVEEKQ